MTILWVLLTLLVLVAGYALFYRRGRHYRGVPKRGGQIGRSRRQAHMDAQVRKWTTGMPG